MTEVLEIYNYVILTWMALMLTIQSYVLWNLLPEIKNVVANTDIGKRLMEAGSSEFIRGLKEKFRS